MALKDFMNSASKKVMHQTEKYIKDVEREAKRTGKTPNEQFYQTKERYENLRKKGY